MKLLNFQPILSTVSRARSIVGSVVDVLVYVMKRHRYWWISGLRHDSLAPTGGDLWYIGLL